MKNTILGGHFLQKPTTNQIDTAITSTTLHLTLSIPVGSRVLIDFD